MNFFEFDQEDFVNPDERVEYALYLKSVEKTLSNTLGYKIDVNGTKQ